MLRQRHHWRWKDVRREFVTPPGAGGRAAGLLPAVTVMTTPFRAKAP